MRSFCINRQHPAAIADHTMHKAFSIDGQLLHSLLKQVPPV